MNTYTLHHKFVLLAFKSWLRSFNLRSPIKQWEDRVKLSILCYVGATQFGGIHARSAFPCFDEPGMKATFQLTMVHDDQDNVYSNTKIIETNSFGNNISISVFEKTVQMSTYHLAFAVCDFERLTKVNSDGTEVGVIFPSQQGDQVKFALDSAADIIEFFAMFFNIPYAFPKLDMIALPDLGPNAMENIALVTFRKLAMLYLENATTSANKEHCLELIVHELAHQWFGNLVTMQWWDDFWLNEGFAVYFQPLGMSALYPDWRERDRFPVKVSQDALLFDSLENSEPVIRDVPNQNQVDFHFHHEIMYNKAGALLYMMENFLGMETMKRVFTIYLTKYAYQNTRTSDFLITFSEENQLLTDLDVSSIMDTWLKQKGYPLIYASVSDGMVRVQQKRFLSAPLEKDDLETTYPSPFGYIWHVPISYLADSMLEPKIFWLNVMEGEFSYPPEATWLKLNVNQTGFYRVMYDKALWKSISQIMNSSHKDIYPTDRANLLDDAFTLARVGRMDIHTVIEFAKYLEFEEDYIPWSAVIPHFKDLNILLHESPHLPLFYKFMKKLLKPIITYVGWTGSDDHLMRRMRSDVLLAALQFEDEDTIEQAMDLFENWMKHNISVHSDLREVVYTAGVMFGGKREWQFCWEKYLETLVPSDKIVLLSALGSTRDAWQLSQYLNYAFNKDKIRQEVATFPFIVAGSNNPTGRLLTWRFIRMNWSKLQKKFGLGKQMGNVLSVLNTFSSMSDYNEIKIFFSGVERPQLLNQSLERIRANMHWRENIEPSVIDWLHSFENENDGL